MRCPVCDREDCPAAALVRAGNAALLSTYEAARRDCAAHAIDWRARAIAAEQRLNAEINKVFAGPLCPRCGEVVLEDEIAKLTAERDAAIRHRAETNAEIAKLHAVIKSKGFSVEDSVALTVLRAELARMRPVVEAAEELRDAREHWLRCSDDMECEDDYETRYEQAKDAASVAVDAYRSKETP